MGRIEGATPRGASRAEQALSPADAGREIIASASASVLVDDVADAAEEITALAARYDGYVESMNVGHRRRRRDADGRGHVDALPAAADRGGTGGSACASPPMT